MFQIPFNKALRLSSANWGLAVGLATLFLWLLSEEFGAPTWLWKAAGGGTIGMSVLLFLASFTFSEPPSSVSARMTLIGILVSPALFLFSTLGLAYIAAAPSHTRAWLWLGVVVSLVVWCFKSVREHRQRIIQKRFIEREFSIEETRIAVRYPFKTDISAPPVSNKTLPGRLFNKFGPYLAVMIPLAYPIQRLLTDTGGHSAVLLLLAVLGLPLAIYILGRFACGAYLWIYKVRELEKHHGKPVVFEA